MVRSDEQLLKQLLLNLTINAIEALDVGMVTIVVTGDPVTPQSLSLCVHNSGRGIDPEVLSRMFEPFFSTKEGGTGLGLAIVHRLATSLETPLAVQSNDENGTSFVLQLTAASVPVALIRPSTDQFRLVTQR